MNTSVTLKRRAAVYTRKSTGEGLDTSFNSLDAQRQACESYVASQKGEGWVLVPDRYDDPAFSGGNIERPALQRLLTDIGQGKIDIVVVYRLDRLCRSVRDYPTLSDAFERNKVSFVSITESFNSSTSAGRLILHTLLTCAQYEREVSRDRVRDKIAASRMRGIWMGGIAPLGYEAKDRKLVIVETEAATVRMIFERFLKLGSATMLARELQAAGVTTRSGKPIDKGLIYKTLNNRVYIGLAVHKGTAYPGEHEGIVSRDLWDKVHAMLAESPRARACRTRAQTPALLKGLIFGADGRAMSPTHTRKRGRLYRYYVAAGLLKGDIAANVVRRVSAAVIEATVVEQIRGLLRAPEMIVRTWLLARREDENIDESSVREALQRFDLLWDELFPAEQARIVQLLLERVDVEIDGVAIKLRAHGLTSLIAELRYTTPSREAA